MLWFIIKVVGCSATRLPKTSARYPEGAATPSSGYESKQLRPNATVNKTALIWLRSTWIDYVITNWIQSTSNTTTNTSADILMEWYFGFVEVYLWHCFVWRNHALWTLISLHFLIKIITEFYIQLDTKCGKKNLI